MGVVADAGKDVLLCKHGGDNKMKKLGIVVIAVVAIIAAGLFWLRGNLDGLVRDAIAKYGSEMTQAQVSVGGVKISATDGQGVISDLVVGNPKGFKTAHAFAVKEFTVAVDPASLTGDVITVRKIAIVAPNVVYEKGDAMTNFDAIQKNIADYLGPSDGKSSQGGKKLIVEELTVTGAKAKAAAPFMDGQTMTVDLPDISLHNMGKSKGGITPGELGKEIAGALQKQLSNAVNFDKLGKAISEKAGATVESAKKAAGSATDKIKDLF